MNKIRVIDLLNKIANGEESDTITEFEFNKSIWNFFKLQDSEYCIDEWLLNQEIVITKHKEIIEEDKKIAKMTPLNNVSGASDLVAISQMQWENNLRIERKINEIIDYLEENKKC